jgi:DNA-directed RNA polymerase specialized sigma24 family protein
MANPDPAVELARAFDAFMNAPDQRSSLRAVEQLVDAAEDLRAWELLTAIEEGMTQEQVGKVLGVSQQAVAKRQAKARVREAERRKKRPTPLAFPRANEDGTVEIRRTGGGS